MITAIITTLNDETRLGATLAALTPAAIDAFVREVIVADGGSKDATLDVAEDAGATVLSGAAGQVLAQACAVARQPWLLILPAGARLQVGWEAAVRGHIRRYPQGAGWFRLSLASAGLGARLDELASNGLARWFGKAQPRHGLLIAAHRWGAAGPLHPLNARILIGAADLE